MIFLVTVDLAETPVWWLTRGLDISINDTFLALLFISSVPNPLYARIDLKLRSNMLCCVDTACS